MKEFPVIRVTLLFAAGIVLQSFFSVTIRNDFILLASLLCAALIIFLVEKRKTSFGALSLILLSLPLLAGYTSGQMQRDNNVIPDSIYVIKNFTAYGSVEEIDLPSQGGFSLILRTDSIKARSTIKTSVKLLCNIRDDSLVTLYSHLNPGNIVKINGTYRKGREERNPGEFDYNKYLHSRKISGVLSVYEKNDISIIAADVDPVKRIIFSARKYIDAVITSMHEAQTAALLKGLLLADRSDIGFETKNQFINSGVVHILAVSGLHTGFIALIFFVLLGRLNLYLRSVLTIIGLILFMIITGIPASVFRAVVMGAVMITAFLLNRSTNIYNSLAIAALILLAADPSEIFNPGFQLSFISVLSIAYFFPHFEKLLKRTGIKNKFLKYILLFAALSLSAQIGTFPITLFYFGKFSLISILMNLAVIPLAGVILGTAISTLILFPISVWAASVYAAANDMFTDLLMVLVKYAGSSGYAFLDIVKYSTADVLIFYLFVMTGIFLVRHLKSFRTIAIFLILITANIYIYSLPSENDLRDKDKLNVFMLDVGQGDSFIIKLPGGKTVLIDAGSASPFFDNGERIILPAMRRLEIEKFDYGFVSHIDADHYGGFISLIEKQKIRNIYKPVRDTTSEKDRRFEQYLRNKNIPVEYYERNRLRIGDTELFILNDNKQNYTGRNSLNNSSGIIKIIYGKTSFLFTGDIDYKGERYYTERYKRFLDSDVLKVSHHGSKSGSSEDFIKLVSPETSLISCGIKNRFGHPSGEVTDRLLNSGSEIFRTDKEGCVLLQSDGMKISRIDWKKYY